MAGVDQLAADLGGLPVRPVVALGPHAAADAAGVGLVQGAGDPGVLQGEGGGQSGDARADHGDAGRAHGLLGGYGLGGVRGRGGGEGGTEAEGGGAAEEFAAGGAADLGGGQAEAPGGGVLGGELPQGVHHGRTGHGGAPQTFAAAVDGDGAPWRSAASSRTIRPMIS